MSYCKGCGDPILWITTKAGKFMPVDEEPVAVIVGQGNERFITDEGDVIVGRRAEPTEKSIELPVGFIPHWKTCPQAGRFRRK